MRHVVESAAQATQSWAKSARKGRAPESIWLCSDSERVRQVSCLYVLLVALLTWLVLPCELQVAFMRRVAPHQSRWLGQGGLPISWSVEIRAW
jgi:hypothetical protein